jgi:predicted RNA-binding protein with EMAP domain
MTLVLYNQWLMALPKLKNCSKTLSKDYKSVKRFFKNKFDINSLRNGKYTYLQVEEILHLFELVRFNKHYKDSNVGKVLCESMRHSIDIDSDFGEIKYLLDNTRFRELLRTNGVLKEELKKEFSILLQKM